MSKKAAEENVVSEAFRAEMDELTSDMVAGEDKLPSQEELNKPIHIDDNSPAPGPAVVQPQAEQPVDDVTARLQAQQEVMSRLMSGKPIIDPPAPAQPEGPTVDQVKAHYEQMLAYQAAAYNQQLAAYQQQQAQQQPQQQAQMIDEETFDKILSDPKQFTAFLQTFGAQVHQAAVQQAYSMAMQHIPQAVLPSVQEAAANQFEVRRWMHENPVVANNRDLARMVLNEVDGYNPNMPLQQKLEVALQHINRLAGPTAPQPHVTQPRPVSNYAPVPRGPLPKPQRKSDLQRELDEL